MKKHGIQIFWIWALFGFVTFGKARAWGEAAPSLVQQYTLENGLSVFLLENPADAMVSVEFICKAGFTSQTQQTNGFFTLFSRLVANSAGCDFSTVECNSDSSKYALTTSPALAEKKLAQLSEAVFNPVFSDEVINVELNKLKREVMENAQTMSFYINAAIDSRVFSESPWKHDSGIYPPLFNKTSQAQARTTLNIIKDRYYTPQNCALFVSGNINAERMLVIIKNTFGKFYTSLQVPSQKPNAPVNAHKKFVFHSQEISDDLTQLVIQYTMLDADSCDILATILNADDSLFKETLLAQEDLNIPGNEYINVAAVHEKGSSRLIFQTLLQKPENKKNQKTSAEQVELFAGTVLRCPDFITETDFINAKSSFTRDFSSSFSNPRSFMQNLADFWVLEDYERLDETDFAPYFDQYTSSRTVAMLMSKTGRIQRLSLKNCVNAFEAEAPFVFVIINSKDYKATKKQYENASYQEITENNSSWYVQSLFAELKNQTATDTLPEYATSRASLQDNDYAQKNAALISERTLKNGITLVAKQNPLSTRTTMLLSIAGGKYNSAENHGFEEVMISLLSSMIQREFAKNVAGGLIAQLPQVSSKTDFATSSITIEFDTDDADAVCAATVNAIIFSEIPPAFADRAVSARQYRKRLENGSSTNQIFYGVIQNLYKNSPIVNVFETNNDILQTTDYKAILTAYPDFLDARRYNIIFTGQTDEKLLDTAEKYFSQLEKRGRALQPIKAKASLQKGKSAYINVVHTFLTDIPASEAGPMPAELIPTTEFLDPVAYVFAAPKPQTKEAALFCAILNYLEDVIQKKVTENRRIPEAEASVILPRNIQDFGTIILQNVRYTKEADAVLKAAINDIKSLLSSSATAESTILEIKDAWNRKQMDKTGSDYGTVLLLQKGFELSPEKPNPALYLQEYSYIQSADARAFLEALSYFSEKPNLSVYSNDSKK